MLLRVVTVLIVLFWLGSIGWLCAVVWAPPGSQLSEVDTREVYDVFFAWNDQVDMTLLENGERRGQITVAGLSGADSESGQFLNELSVSGSFEEFKASDAATASNLFWKGVMELDENLKLNSTNFSLRIPRRQLQAEIDIAGDPRRFRARATLGEAEIFSLDGETGGGVESLPLQMLPMGSMLGDLNLDPSQLRWESNARMGTFKFEGRPMRAYLLTMRAANEGQELRLFLSEAGEPLKIETDLGFEAVSEILVPLDVYRTRSAEKE